MRTSSAQKISNQLCDKADRLYQSGMCDPAVDFLLAAIQEYPDEKRFYSALSEMLIDSEQYQDALDILNKIPSGQEDQQTRILSGMCKLGLGLFEEADTIANVIEIIGSSIYLVK